jgi:two-component system chemotaxis response regulator CheB
MPSSQPVRLLIVDDSATVRSVLKRYFEADPRFEVVGLAKDGLEALELLPELKPDVVTLDIEMPRLNGLETLPRLMKIRPTPVVMVSSLTTAGAEATLEALELGAVDFIPKPSSRLAPSEEVLEKVIAAAGARVRVPSATRPQARRPSQAVSPAGTRWTSKVIVIGSSTGGPQALKTVVEKFPADLKVPVVMVQHMPPGFTKTLAERLDSITPLAVVEATEGTRLEPGKIVLAPGDYHLEISSADRVVLSQGPTECGVRPAINVTLESVVQRHGDQVVAAILTGMGSDGTRGSRLVKQAGGYVVAQDEATSTVYGMARSVAEAGLVDEVRPLNKIAEALVAQCRIAARRSA